MSYSILWCVEKCALEMRNGEIEQHVYDIVQTALQMTRCVLAFLQANITFK